MIHDTHRAHSNNSFISWRSILAGVLISSLCFTTLMALGIGFGGIAMSDLEGFQTLGWSAAIWTIVAAMVSLYVGSYAASRVSNFVSTQVGMVQGATISAAFIVLVFWSGGALFGAITGAVTSATKALAPSGGSVQAVAQQIGTNPEIRQMVRSELTDLGIQPEQVDQMAAGLLSRMVFEGPESAKNYLVSQTDLTEQQIQQVEQRLSEVQARVKETALKAAEQTAQGAAAAGWFMFGMILLTAGSGIFGGASGAKRNTRKPIEDQQRADFYAA